MKIHQDNFQQKGASQYVIGKRQLPSVLNVISILTFIGCGISIIGALLLMSVCQLIGSSSGGQGLASELFSSIEDSCNGVQATALGAIGSAVLCIVGAIIMRKLNRIGFFIYIAGCLLPYLIIVAKNGFGKLSSLAQQPIGIILTLVFIGMYTSQLKYFNK